MKFILKKVISFKNSKPDGAIERDQKARSKPLRKDVRTIEVQEGLEFDVYWKDTGKIGIGPAVAVYVCLREVLRFDCFGPDLGHFHIFNGPEQPKGERHRIFFQEDSRPDQIQRTIWEIKNNLGSYLQLHSDLRIKNFPIDQKGIKGNMNQLEAILMSHKETVEEYMCRKK